MMDQNIGRQLGNYRLVQLLGQGGFAEVYLGEHVRLDMKAAVKLLHANLVGNEIEAFQQEAQIIAKLEHPNIVRILDFDVQDQTPFLILDYAPNGSLREKHPRGRPVPLPLVVQYVQQVASALQYAHDHKLIHRDVKPENMLIGKQGEVRLSDFGIAAVAHSTSSMRTESTTGTLAYMAPEQIYGKPRPASDQYALAVTVYQWLSGELPFQGSSTEIIAQHLAATPPPLRSKVPSISPELEQVVMTALEKDPKDRFANVEAFATALTQACGLKQAPLEAPLPVRTPIPPTQPAVPPVVAASPVPSPQEAPVLDTPEYHQLERFDAPENRFVRAADKYRPLYPPVYAPARARSTSNWGKWLIGTVIITVLGVCALVIIPPLVVYGHLGGPSTPNNSGTLSDADVQATADEQSTLDASITPTPTSTLITTCAVGTNYDLASGKLIGKSSIYPKASALTLACRLPKAFFSSTYTLTSNKARQSVEETIDCGEGNRDNYSAGGDSINANANNAEADAAHYTYFDQELFLDPGSCDWSISISYWSIFYGTDADAPYPIIGSTQVTIQSGLSDSNKPNSVL